MTENLYLRYSKPQIYKLNTEQIFKLERVSCQHIWRLLMGCKAQSHISLLFMQKAISYEVQCQKYGGLSKTIKRQLNALLKNDKRNNLNIKRSPINKAVMLTEGMVLIREWHGLKYRVDVGKDDYLYDGKSYSSLSAIARKITKAHWSGPRFFGLKKPRSQSEASSNIGVRLSISARNLRMAQIVVSLVMNQPKSIYSMYYLSKSQAEMMRRMVVILNHKA